MPPAPRRILVIQLRRIGDVVLALPAVSALKRAHPEAAIDFLVEPPAHELVEGYPGIGAVHVYRGKTLREAWNWLGRIRELGYDWVIDFMGNPRSAILTAASRAPVRAGPAHVWHRWAYNVALEQSDTTHYAALEKIRVLKALGVAEPEPAFMPSLRHICAGVKPLDVVGLVPGSRRDTRRWPAASFAALGRMLRDAFGVTLVVFWGPGEKELAEEVAAAIGRGAAASPQTATLKDLARALARCRLVVTNCNGPRHIATAVGTPTVTIHGSSDPESWNPPHPDHLVAREDDLFCIGCGLNSCPYQLECMRLSPEKVFKAAQTLLSRKVAA